MENDERLPATSDGPAIGKDRNDDVPGGDVNQVREISQLPDVLRLFADQVLPVARGSQMQLSLLVEDHDPISMEYSHEAKGRIKATVKTGVAHVEIGKVRMPMSEAFSMAMQIIEVSIVNGRVKVGSFRNAVNSMLDRYEAGESAPDAAGDTE